MARRRSFFGAIAQAQRAAAAAQRAQMRAAEQARHAAIRAQREYDRAQRGDEKERRRLYLESRLAEAEEEAQQLQAHLAKLSTLLVDTLRVNHFINPETLKTVPAIPEFNPGVLGIAKTPPSLESYLPQKLSVLGSLIPGARRRHAERTAKAEAAYQADLAAHSREEAERMTRFAEAQKQHAARVAEIENQTAAQHAEIDQFRRELASGSREAVETYFGLVLDRSTYPESFPQRAKLAYVTESKQLVVEYDLPQFAIVPSASSYKYVEASDEIAEVPRPEGQRKQLYASIVAQVTLRTLRELFDADRGGYLETVVFNGHVDTIDKGTGHAVRPCLVTVRSTRERFTALDLVRVEPLACLKTLNASVSKSPAELAPVRPVLEFNMADHRFIRETDVLSTLDQRPNLMTLTPSEFESLITNLFERMGLETRLTQASRDGGVDCVAYDQRPIFGGKVVIQAKRYRHTVGVSAVRDLFGTVQNEGASKGILVTTSGYGRASYDFAEGKPLELLSGSHLLHLLAEHAGIEAKIEPPDDWKDPEPDSS
jgi:restriction system protein